MLYFFVPSTSFLIDILAYCNGFEKCLEWFMVDTDEFIHSLSYPQSGPGDAIVPKKQKRNEDDIENTYM